jgi:two-component system response regulator ChvI
LESESLYAIVLNMKKNVAIVDDEKNIRETVSYALKKEGFESTGYPDGLSAWEAFQKSLPDLVILDILMPRMDGLELCKRLRKLSEALPVIFLTSKDEEIDRVLGLEIGGDDYLCKPFFMRELITRIKVLFRRLNYSRESKRNDEVLQIDDLHLNLKQYTAFWKNNHIKLTVTEFLLLYSLVKNPGHVKTREQLMETIYPQNTFVSDRTIDSHVKRLRQKIQSMDNGFSNIETVYGLGYRYKP